MKRLIYIIVALLTLTSCEWGEEYTPNRTIGSWMWQGVREDIERVVEILELLELYGDYTLIDNEAEQQDFLDAHFRGYQISVNDNLHTLVYDTAYGGSITTLITVHDSTSWHITRSGGNSYDLDLKLLDGGIFRATFNSLCHDESTGNGEFTAYRDAEHNFVLEGNMKMVDPEESVKRPLTLTTNIKQPMVINREYNRLLGGKVDIVCYDKMYDSTDYAMVEIIKNRDDIDEYDATVYIHCYNDIETYDNAL